MTSDEAISRMKSPGERGVLQIVVTSACDLLTCSNCTQLLPYQREPFVMTPEQFERAVLSLAGYPGIVGLFGGNPCTSVHFGDYCAILRRHVPPKQRGIWTNNPLGREAEIRETFGSARYNNLNLHRPMLKPEKAEAVKASLQAASPRHQVWGDGELNHHASILTAVQDFLPADAMWEAISGCDINHRWSGAIIPVHGEVYGFFCEVAAAFARVYPDRPHFGKPVSPGWWRAAIGDYGDQITRFCVECGVALRLRGHVDADRTYDLSPTHYTQLTVRRGRVAERRIDSLAGEPRTHESTDYQSLRS